MKREHVSALYHRYNFIPTVDNKLYRMIIFDKLLLLKSSFMKFILTKDLLSS